MSLCLTAAFIWGGAGMTILAMHWIGEHPDVAKAMSLLPVIVLPLVALVLHRRRRGAMISD